MWLSSVRNAFHSAILVGAMVALLAAVGGLFGGPFVMVVLIGLGIAFFGFGPSMGSRMLLRMQGAIPLPPYAAARIHDLVTQLSRRAGLSTVPQLYVVPSRAASAFTTGPKESASIALTQGLLYTLNFRELAGVLAHEVSHIKRNDIFVMGLANFITRATNFMSTAGQILLFLNLPLLLMGQVTLPWTAILLLVFAPTIAVLLQLALSRTREYQADAGAVQLTGDAAGLAAALAKLERVKSGFLDHLLLRRREPGWISLLQTHPSTRRRINRLVQLGDGALGGRAIA